VGGLKLEFVEPGLRLMKFLFVVDVGIVVSDRLVWSDDIDALSGEESGEARMFCTAGDGLDVAESILLLPVRSFRAFFTFTASG
jgi:hypothetical protein